MENGGRATKGSLIVMKNLNLLEPPSILSLGYLVRNQRVGESKRPVPSTFRKKFYNFSLGVFIPPMWTIWHHKVTHWTTPETHTLEPAPSHSWKIYISKSLWLHLIAVVFHKCLCEMFACSSWNVINNKTSDYATYNVFLVKLDKCWLLDEALQCCTYIYKYNRIVL